MNLLFVCTGNTCRSPAAAAIAAAMAEQRDLTGVQVTSAGTFAFAGQPAAAVSIAVAADRGIDLESHRSQEVGLELVEWADYIIAMTESHGRGVTEIAPGARVHLLAGFLPENHDRHGLGIADPFGGDRAVYEDTYDEMEEAVSAFFDHLDVDEGVGGP